jgi:cation diffusion facilitator CzcD-associated flavoprotein CzcO
MLYSFSFERNDRWSRIYPPQGEIWEYLRRCVERHRIGPHIRFDTDVRGAEYDDASATWTVRTQHGELRTRVIVSGMGPLNRANVPDIPGLQSFAGTVFHSSAWNHGYDLRGKNVGVIGTGASSIQFVPEIAPVAGRLHVFQRTPPWVIPKPDRVVGPLGRTLRRFPPYAWAVRKLIYWILEVRAYGFTVDPKRLELAERLSLHHLARQVPGAELRAKLTPAYRLGCKRVLLSSDYYPALQRPNVELVTSEIREVQPGGVVTADGVVRPLDALVFGTGFHAADGVAPMSIVGRGGVTLDDAWRDGARAYLGISVAGFPNLFLLIGPNTGLGHNSMVFMIEAQIRYVMSALAHMRRARVPALDVRREVQAGFNAALQRRMARTVWASGCTSWYLDRSGRNTTLWPGFTFVYRFLTRRLDPRKYERA